MREKIVIANWKMNPSQAKDASSLFSVSNQISKRYKTTVVVCPPQVFISLFPKNRYKKLLLGAQDISTKETGAFTGEIGSSVLKPFGVSYVIVGHSERREMGESREVIAEKIKTALRNKITPVLCIGENKRDGEGHFFHFLKEEILFFSRHISKKDVNKVIIAYEPVWAVGSKSKGVMSSQDIHETIMFLRKILSDKFGNESASKIRILYGGSVDHKNSSEIAKVSGCGGLLLGRASLSKDQLENIVRNLSK